MTNVLKIKTDVKGLDVLDKYIGVVEKFVKSKQDVGFQKFLQEKVLDIARLVSDRLLVGGTTNDDAIELYKSNHKIREEEEGFVLYNDTQIPAIVKGTQNTIDNYPDGMFPIALAFEYGVGIIGTNTANHSGSWEYNLQGYNFGWYLPQEVTGKVGVQTGGYMGFEIYRNIAKEVQDNLGKWTIEYFDRKR